MESTHFICKSILFYSLLTVTAFASTPTPCSKSLNLIKTGIVTMEKLAKDNGKNGFLAGSRRSYEAEELLAESQGQIKELKGVLDELVDSANRACK